MKTSASAYHGVKVTMIINIDGDIVDVNIKVDDKRPLWQAIF